MTGAGIGPRYFYYILDTKCANDYESYLLSGNSAVYKYRSLIFFFRDPYSMVLLIDIRHRYKMNHEKVLQKLFSAAVFVSFVFDLTLQPASQIEKLFGGCAQLCV